MEKTKKEIADDFLNHVKAQFNKATKNLSETDKEKVDLMIFSILVAIDGDSYMLPRFILASDPDPEDNEGYPDNNNVDIKGDISGDLHDRWCNLK